jgi:hypothetical protein
MKNHNIHFELVTKNNGFPQYAQLSELEDDDLVAEVKVITKNGKEISRDQFVPDEAWMTVTEYLKK